MRRAILFFLVLLLAACDRGATADRTIEQQLFVFGTVVTITYYGVDPVVAEQAGGVLNSQFRRMHREWHAWEPGPLVDLNRSIAEGKAAPVIPSLIPLIERSKRIYALSDGLFNPAIGRLLNLWGFQRSERPNGPPPSRLAVRELIQMHPTMDDVELRGGILYSKNRSVQMDFGGIAKGYAVDLALARLKELGIRNAIINAGGGLGVIGSHGSRPWRVGIRHPQGKGVIGSLEMHDGESVHTSGNYERFREYRGVHYAHILDPRTGWPVEDITSASVLGPDGTLADAAATALVVAGSKNWLEVARKMGLHYAMLVEEDGTVYMTPQMATRVEFTGKRPSHVVISEEP